MILGEPTSAHEQLEDINFPDKEPSASRQIFEFFIELIKVILISLAIIIPVRYFLIQPFYVKGASMEPNFHDHEYLIIDEFSYRFTKPQRGDIVVFRYPLDQSQYFIKRIIGFPGETIEIRDNSVYIYNESQTQGIQLEENYIPEAVFTNGSDRVVLGEDEYYVLGDNRDSSLDSRRFGPIEESDIIGKVWFRGWPFQKFSFFKSPMYNI